MMEAIYAYRDKITEQSSDFLLIERNDRAAMRRFKQYANKMPNPDEHELLCVGTYDRDLDKGSFTAPRLVEELVAPGGSLSEDEIAEARRKGMLPPIGQTQAPEPRAE